MFVGQFLIKKSDLSKVFQGSNEPMKNKKKDHLKDK
jgi:hypothetical protein